MFLHFLLGICSEYKMKTLPWQTKETKSKNQGTMAKKEVRCDGTYLISADKTENPKLYARMLTDGRESGATDKPCGEGVRMLTQNCC